MSDLIPTDDGRKPRPQDVICGSPLDDTVVAYAEEALSTLWQIAGMDCWCRDRESACEPCIARKAMEQIRKIAYPVVRSLRPDRLCYAEAVFFEKWVEENTRQRGVNGNCGLLELLLSDDPNQRRARITQRDMDVATAVVQWLGTNCGLCFLSECEREVKRRKAMRADLFQWSVNKRPFDTAAEETELSQMAGDIAQRFGTTSSGRSQLKAEILGLLSKQKQQLSEAIAAMT